MNSKDLLSSLPSFIPYLHPEIADYIQRQNHKIFMLSCYQSLTIVINKSTYPKSIVT